MAVYFICENIEGWHRGRLRSERFFLLSEAKRWLIEHFKQGLISEYNQKGERLTTYYVSPTEMFQTIDFQ